MAIDIFIASSFKDDGMEEFKFDFIEERKVLKEVINNETTLNDISLDYGNSSLKSTNKLSLESIKKADVIIILIGRRYGSIRSNGISLTHEEYREAIKLNKPIFSYKFPLNEEDDDYEFTDKFLKEIYSNDNHTVGEIKTMIDKEYSNILKYKQSISTISKPTQKDIKNYSKNIALKIIIDIVKNSKRIKSLRKSNILTFDNTCTNKINKIDYKSIVPRKQDIENINNFLAGNIESSFIFIEGNAGIGKSSFMTDFFNSTKNIFNSFMYFIDDKEDDETLESLYMHIYQKFQFIIQDFSQDIFQLLNSLEANLPMSDKFNKLFEIYDKYYIKTNKKFILMIDGIDLLELPENILKKVIHPNNGIHFILSGRQNKLNNFYLSLSNKYDFFEKKFIELKNLDNNHISQVIELQLNQYTNLSKQEKNDITKLLIIKSDGLPLYLKYQIDTINKNIIGNVDVYLNMKNFIEKLPNKIGDFYKEIFQNLDEYSLSILQVLYWNNNPIKIKIIKQIIKLNDDEFEKSINNISYLLSINKFNNEISICHLSVKESLFEYYKYNKQNIQIAKKIDKSFIKGIIINEDSILEEVVLNNSIIDNFKEIIYYDSKNILFIQLENIINYYLFSDKSNKKLVNLFYEYIKILFLMDNIDKNNIFNTNETIYNIFKEFKVSSYIKDISNKFFAYSVELKLENIFEIKKLIDIAIITENTYFIAKYIKQLFEFKYTLKLRTAYNSENLVKNEYNILPSILTKSYITRIRELENKDNSLSLLYDDSNIVVYTTSKSKDIYLSLFNTIDSALDNKRQQIDKLKRIFNIIKYTTDSNLIKAFIKRILFFKYKNTNENTKKKIQELLYECQYLLLINNLNNFSNEDNNYKYLVPSKKETIQKMRQIYNIYLSEGIEVILKRKNIQYILDIIKLIHPKDMILLFECYLEQNLKTIYIEAIIQMIVLYINDDENLNYFKDYIYTLDYKSNKLLLISLMNIHYKQKDIKSLKLLEPYIIYIEYMQEERTLLLKVMATVKKDFTKLYKIYPQKNSFIKSVQNNFLDIYEIDEVFEYLLLNNDLETIKQVLPIFFNNSNASLTMKKKMYTKYKNYINIDIRKEIVLDFYLQDNIDLFLQYINKLSKEHQVNFLNKNINYMLKKEYKTIETNKFWEYFLTLFTKDINRELVLLLQKVYTKYQFICYCQNNGDVIFDKYNQYKKSTFGNNLKVKFYFYVSYLLTLDEESYTNLFTEKWIPLDMIDEVTVMAFMFNSINQATPIEFLKYLQDSKSIIKGKIYLYSGFKYKNIEFIKKGLEISQKLSNSKYNLNNTIAYTLPDIINNKNTSELLSILTIPNYKSYLNIQVFFELILKSKEEDIFKEIDKIKNSNEFISIFMSYFMNKKDLKTDEFIHDDINIINHKMLTLYDIYKQAEINEDEVLFEQCESIFNDLKLYYLNNASLIKMIEEKFSNFRNSTLDNLFFKYNITKEDNTKLDIKLIKINYLKFYENLKELYTEYEYANDNKLIEAINNKFIIFKDELNANPEYIELLKEKSHITSKLQIKLINIDKFKPNINS